MAFFTADNRGSGNGSPSAATALTLSAHHSNCHFELQGLLFFCFIGLLIYFLLMTYFSCSAVEAGQGHVLFFVF